MSLKAKIEAVIYAAEEPVTLAQLVGLLGQEAQAELDRLRSAQASLALADGAREGDGIPLPSEPDLLNEEILAIEDEPESGLPLGVTTGGQGAGEMGAADEAAERFEPGGPGWQINDAARGNGDGSLSGDAAGRDAEPAAGASGAEPLDEKAEKLALRERERALRERFRELLAELVRDYAEGDRGLEIREVAGGYRFATKPEYHDAVRGFVKGLKPALKLTLQALETLAVVAYKQPVTAPEISEIRGVDSGGVLGSLMARKLVTTAGRKQVIGRPILYRTTKDFLLRFGLKDTSELPSIEEFEKMAGELAEPEETAMMMNDTGAESPHSDPEMAGMGAVSPGIGGLGNDVVGTGDGGGSIDEAPGVDVPPSQGDVTEPQADGDGSPADEVEVDGRMAGILPGEGDVPVDSSEGDAMIKDDQRAAEEER